MKHTRADYMNHVCTHREYYGQFVTPSIKQVVLSRIGTKEYIKGKLVDDKNMNNIPLTLWDNLPGPIGINKAMKEVGDYFTLSGKVCIYKEAARQITEED